MILILSVALFSHSYTSPLHNPPLEKQQKEQSYSPLLHKAWPCSCRQFIEVEKIINVINCTDQHTSKLSMFVVKIKDRLALNVLLLVIADKTKQNTSDSSLQLHFCFDTRKSPCCYKHQWIYKFFLHFFLGMLCLSQTVVSHQRNPHP